MCGIGRLGTGPCEIIMREWYSLRRILRNERRASRGGRSAIDVSKGFGDGLDLLFPLLLQLAICGTAEKKFPCLIIQVLNSPFGDGFVLQFPNLCQWLRKYRAGISLYALCELHVLDG